MSNKISKKKRDIAKKNAIIMLKNLQTDGNVGDIEASHGLADGILCKLLTYLGYEDVVNEYNNVDKWYG